MTRLYVLMLVISVLWIFGTLPWLVVNRLLCASSASDVCAHPDFGQQASSILLLDALLIATSVYAIVQLRRVGRSR